MTPWDWLGIEQDATEAEVKRAYAKALRRHRPDEDPQGFQTTHEAYRIALQWARQQAAGFDEADPADSRAADTVPTVPIVEPDLAAPSPPAATCPEPESASDAGPPALADSHDASDAPADARRPPDPLPAKPTESDASVPEPDADETVESDGFMAPEPDPASRTQPFLPLDFDAPTLRQLLDTPTAAIDLGGLRSELAAALAGLDSAQRQHLAERIAVAVEHWDGPPAPGVVSLLAELLDWDTVFLRHRNDRIAILLAADEAHAALQARLQGPAHLQRPLHALARPVRLLDPACWPLWLSTGKVEQTLAQIEAQSPIALLQLNPAAIRLTRTLMDKGHIGLMRLLRWLALAGVTGLAVLLQALTQGGVAVLGSGESWAAAGLLGGFVLAAAYLRARVLQIYALPRDRTRPLWLMLLLLGLLVLVGTEPGAFTAPAWLLFTIAATTAIGRQRFLPGLLAFGAAVMLPAALPPTLNPLADLASLGALVLLTGLILAIDHVSAARDGLTLAEARAEEKPLYLLGAALFVTLLLVGAATEDARQPVTLQPHYKA